jgi:hypothetical protein
VRKKGGSAMKFLDRFEVVPVLKGELNSLGCPRKHRCMRCGVNHKIIWENIRYRDGVINFGKTVCSCGDDVVSIWGEPMALAVEFAELYSKENPVNRKR